MNFIKLFLASSIVEFAEERLKLYLALFKFNDFLVEYTDYEIDIDRCEELDINILKSGIRTQDIISEMIIKSNFCVFLIGNKVGTVTKEELDLAIENYRKNKMSIPIIFIFEKEHSDNTISDVIKELNDHSIPYMYVKNYHHVLYSLLFLLEDIFNEKWELFIFNNKLWIEDVIIDEQINYLISSLGLDNYDCNSKILINLDSLFNRVNNIKEIYRKLCIGGNE